MSAEPPSSISLPPAQGRRLLFVVTEDWYFLSHRLPAARAAMSAGFSVAVACNVGAGRDAIEAEGISVIPIPVRRRSINPWHEARTIIALVRAMRRFRPDLIHAVALKSMIEGGIAARLSGCRAVVLALAGLGYLFAAESLKARVLRFVIARILRWLTGRPGTRFLAQNADDIQTLSEIGALGETVPVLIPGSGVDTARFRPQPARTSERGQTQDPVCVTLVARMLVIKGVADFAAAAGILRARGVPVAMRLVGAPDLLNNAAIDQTVLEGWVAEGLLRWDGPRTDIATVWSQSDIAVLPSHAGEGVPKSLLEAAACGKPLIATDVPGCRDICRPGESGVLVPPRDPSALADAIAGLAADAEARARLGAGARHLAETRFSETVVSDMTRRLYLEMLGERA